MWYSIVLVAFLLIYFFVFFLMKKFTNTRLTNIIFILVIQICYIGLVIKVFFDVGFNDWNFKNTLPTANISPFMFFSTILYFILPKKIKKYYLTLISILFFGMFMSPLLSIVQRILINYRFIPHFLLDYIAHFTISLWGIYLIRSKQIKFNKKDCIIGCLIIFGVVFLMIICNIILGTSFFGLTFTKDYNIYNMVLVNNAYLSALIYFLGLCVVLIVGYILQRIINKKFID